MSVNKSYKKITLLFTISLIFGCLLNGCSWLVKQPTVPIIDEPEINVKKQWMAQAGMGSHDSYLRLQPAVMADKVITSSANGLVIALDNETGQTLWRFKAKHPLSSSPSTGEDLVFVGGESKLFALNSETGQQQWEVSLPGQVLAAPAYSAGVVIVKTIDGELLAFDAASGDKRWQFRKNLPRLTLRSSAKPVVIGPLVISGFSDGRLVALTVDQGKLVWEKAIAQPSGFSDLARMVDISADPVIYDDVIFVASYQGNVSAMSLTSGEILWSQPLSSHAGLTVSRQGVFVTEANGRVWAFNRDTGDVLWRQNELQDRQVTGPAVIGDALVVADDEGYVHWMAQQDGHFVSRQFFNPAGVIAQPLADADKVLLISRGGVIASLMPALS